MTLRLRSRLGVIAFVSLALIGQAAPALAQATTCFCSITGIREASGMSPSTLAGLATDNQRRDAQLGCENAPLSGRFDPGVFTCTIPRACDPSFAESLNRAIGSNPVRASCVAGGPAVAATGSTTPDAGPPLAPSAGPPLAPAASDAPASEEAVRGTNGSSGDPAPPFVPIRPNPSVPIPGVQFTDARSEDGMIEIPYLAQYIGGIYRLSVGLGAILAAVMIVYGGFRYMVAAALPEVKESKTIITDAVIGLVVLLTSFLILKTINPKLVEMAPLRVRVIEREAGDSNIADSFAREAGPDLSDVSSVGSGAPYSGGNFFRNGGGPGGSGRTSQGGTACAQRVDDGTNNARSGWKRTLRPVPSRDSHVVWCANCASGPVSCDDSNQGADAQCLRITGERGATACGGQFGLYLRGMTGACISKQFDSIEGLDGITFGIRGFWAENIPNLMTMYVNEDRAAFEEVFRDAHLSEWYQNGIVNRDWFCQKQTELRGLSCDASFREALRTSGRRPTLIKAQLREAWSRFSNAYNRAAHYFNSDYGRIMWTILANNPGNQDRCDLPVLYEACRSSGNEEAIIMCILGDGTRNIGAFAQNRCRGGQASAMARTATIRSRLEGVSMTSATPSEDTLDTIVSRCLGTGTPPPAPPTPSGSPTTSPSSGGGSPPVSR